jgi:phage-related minor tail protein
VFHTQEFKLFQSELLSRINTTPTPSSVLLQTAMPVVEEALKDIRSDIKRSLTDVLDLKEGVRNIQEDIGEFGGAIKGSFDLLRYDIGRGLNSLFTSLTSSIVCTSNRLI